MGSKKNSEKESPNRKLGRNNRSSSRHLKLRRSSQTHPWLRSSTPSWIGSRPTGQRVPMTGTSCSSPSSPSRSEISRSRTSSLTTSRSGHGSTFLIPLDTEQSDPFRDVSTGRSSRAISPRVRSSESRNQLQADAKRTSRATNGKSCWNEKRTRTRSGSVLSTRCEGDPRVVIVELLSSIGKIETRHLSRRLSSFSSSESVSRAAPKPPIAWTKRSVFTRRPALTASELAGNSSCMASVTREFPRTGTFSCMAR